MDFMISHMPFANRCRLNKLGSYHILKIPDRHFTRSRHSYSGKNFSSFSASDEKQLLNSLVSHPRRILRKVRVNVQCSAQRLLTFRNLLTQIMILLQSRLKDMHRAPQSTTDSHAQKEYKHISMLLEMMLEECREFRCVDLAHLIFRAWLRFHSKYGLEISSEAVLVLLDIAKRNAILHGQGKSDDKVKSTKAFLETISAEMENMPTTLELSLIPLCYLEKHDKIREVKEKIAQNRGSLTAETYISLCEGYGILNKPEEILKLLHECLNCKSLPSNDNISQQKARSFTITRMVQAAISTLSNSKVGMSAEGSDKLPMDKSSPLHKLHCIVMFHLSHGYGVLNKNTLSSLASVFLFRRNARNTVSFVSPKFCRNPHSTSQIEKILISYCERGKGYEVEATDHDFKSPGFDYKMLGLNGLCAMIAANSYITKLNHEEVEDVMKEKLETLLSIVFQRLEESTVESERTIDMIEAQHIIVCIRGLQSLNDKENILKLFNRLQSACFDKQKESGKLELNEAHYSGSLLNYDMYKEFIVSLGRLGNIRDVLHIKAQLENDPVYGWETAHTSYNFHNGKEYSSSSAALMDIYGALLRIFRVSYPHHFHSIESELKERNLTLNAACYCSLLEFYLAERADDPSAVSSPRPDGERGISKKFHDITDEIDKRASSGSSVWSVALLKVLIKAHTFTPLSSHEKSDNVVDYKRTKAYGYILLAKRLGYVQEPALQRHVVKFFLTHGCKDELRKFLLEIGHSKENIESTITGASDLRAMESTHNKTWDLPNIDVCNSLIEYHGTDSFHKGALQSLLGQMERKEIALNEHTFLLLVEIYGRWGEEEKLEVLLKRLNETTRHTSRNSKSKSDVIEPEASKCIPNLSVSEAAPDHRPLCLSNDFTLSATFFSTLAQAYNNLGKADHEIEYVWENLLSTTLVISANAYNVFLNIFVNRMNFVQVERILAAMMDKVPPNVLTLTTVIDLLGRMGKIEEMERIFEEMLKSKKPQDNKNAAEANSQVDEGVSCFPTSVTFHHLMSAYSKRGDVFKIMNVLEKMKTHGIPQSAVTYNILIAGYCRARQYNKVKEVIDERKQVLGKDIDIITSLVWIKSLGLCQLENEVSAVEAQVKQKRWLTDKRVKVSFKFKLLYTLAVAFKNCHNCEKAVHFCQALLSDEYSSQLTFFYVSSTLKVLCTLNQEDLIESFVEKYIFKNLQKKQVKGTDMNDWESSCFERVPARSQAFSVSKAQIVNLASIVLQHFCKTKQMDKVEALLKKLSKSGVKFDKGKESIQLASYMLELKAHKQKEMKSSDMFFGMGKDE